MGDRSSIPEPGSSIRPILTLEEAQGIVKEKYGFDIKRIVQLDGYDDKNYCITVRTTEKAEIVDRKYVFKIINSVDSKNISIFEAQTELLQYLGKIDIVKCPVPVPTRNGKFLEFVHLSSGQHIIRLLDYIEGTILHETICPPKFYYELGYTIGKLNIAMKDFYHAAYNDRTYLWMLQCVPQISQYVFAVTDEGRRKMVTFIIGEFENRVLAISETLDKGLIHGDVNEQNIILERGDDEFSIGAIIDFGDTHIGCYLYEIAITMTYMILTSGNIETGGYVLAGYNSVKKVSEEELALLKVCIAARLCQSLVMGAYSILLDPENTYVLTTALKGWTLLEEIWRQPDSELLEKWKRQLEG